MTNPRITNLDRSSKFIEVEGDQVYILILKPWLTRAQATGLEFRWESINQQHRTTFPFNLGLEACLRHASKFKPERFGLNKVLARTALTAAPGLKYEVLRKVGPDEKRWLWLCDNGKTYETPDYLDVVRLMLLEVTKAANLTLKP